MQWAQRLNLQLRLKNKGYDCGGRIFGRMTLAQVLLFQYDNKLDIDGIVAETWGKLGMKMYL